MNIKCRQCGEWFIPSEDTLDLIAKEFISTDSVNTCDSSWDMLMLSEYDLTDSFSDADPGL
jgi:hypothetical protein